MLGMAGKPPLHHCFTDTCVPSKHTVGVYPVVLLAANPLGKYNKMSCSSREEKGTDERRRISLGLFCAGCKGSHQPPPAMPAGLPSHEWDLPRCQQPQGRHMGQGLLPPTRA